MSGDAESQWVTLQFHIYSLRSSILDPQLQVPLQYLYALDEFSRVGPLCSDRDSSRMCININLLEQQN